MEDSIFTKIIQGEIPAHKVYEDEHALAFMDIHPIQPGMVIVVSKDQVDHFMDLSEDAYTGLMLAVRRVAQKMHAVFPDRRVGVQIEGLEVAHAHVKLFPIATAADFHAAQPSAESPVDHEALAAMAQKLAL